jgi:hypothetical protein
MNHTTMAMTEICCRRRRTRQQSGDGDPPGVRAAFEIPQRCFRDPVRDILHFCRFSRKDEPKPTSHFLAPTKNGKTASTCYYANGRSDAYSVYCHACSHPCVSKFHGHTCGYLDSRPRELRHATLDALHLATDISVDTNLQADWRTQMSAAMSTAPKRTTQMPG